MQKISRWVSVAFLGVALTIILGVASVTWAASIFLTGHDPDFHAIAPSNTTGARNINNAAIGFIRDSNFNPFVSATSKFLFVESKGSIPGGHRQGKIGIAQSGFVESTDFEHHDFTTLNAELDLLGIKYDAIVVASDFGGILRQAELDILNARAGDIIDFLNQGGGLYAMAESNNGAGLTPLGGQFGFLPFVVSSTPANQSEIGFTVTPFGASLGLMDSDVNGNASHNVFDDSFGLNVVDFDNQGRILSLAGRGKVNPGGVCPLDVSPRTLGFWKRICQKDHPEFSGDERMDLIAAVSEALGVDACAALSQNGTKCERAFRQRVALEFNLQSGLLGERCELDDPDFAAVGEALTEIDADLASGEDARCVEANELADDINNGANLAP
jgi:hypothetical protein